MQHNFPVSLHTEACALTMRSLCLHRGQSRWCGKQLTNVNTYDCILSNIFHSQFVKCFCNCYLTDWMYIFVCYLMYQYLISNYFFWKQLNGVRSCGNCLQMRTLVFKYFATYLYLSSQVVDCFCIYLLLYLSAFVFIWSNVNFCLLSNVLVSTFKLLLLSWLCWVLVRLTN